MLYISNYELLLSPKHLQCVWASSLQSADKCSVGFFARGSLAMLALQQGSLAQQIVALRSRQPREAAHSVSRYAAIIYTFSFYKYIDTKHSINMKSRSYHYPILDPCFCRRILLHSARVDSLLLVIYCTPFLVFLSFFPSIFHSIRYNFYKFATT